MKYYSLLKVSSDATLEEIEKNYQLLIKKIQNGSPLAESIVEAYETLSDSRKRLEYDKSSEDGEGEEFNSLIAKKYRQVKVSDVSERYLYNENLDMFSQISDLGSPAVQMQMGHGKSNSSGLSSGGNGIFEAADNDLVLRDEVAGFSEWVNVGDTYGRPGFPVWVYGGGYNMSMLTKDLVIYHISKYKPKCDIDISVSNDGSSYKVKSRRAKKYSGYRYDYLRAHENRFSPWLKIFIYIILLLFYYTFTMPFFWVFLTEVLGFGPLLGLAFAFLVPWIFIVFILAYRPIHRLIVSPAWERFLNRPKIYRVPDFLREKYGIF